jgi:hypothetical protein
VEELFPVNPLPPHKLSTHISSLQELFDPKYKPFIDRIIHTYAYSHLSLGHVVLRPHMCIDTHPTGQNTLVGPIMIEGLIDSHIYPDPSAAYRPWILNKHDKRGKQIICNKTIIEAPAVLGSLYLPPTSTRRLYSMANYDPITVYHDQCHSRTLLWALISLRCTYIQVLLFQSFHRLGVGVSQVGSSGLLMNNGVPARTMESAEREM